jgi:hypothetical protein
MRCIDDDLLANRVNCQKNWKDGRLMTECGEAALHDHHPRICERFTDARRQPYLLFSITGTGGSSRQDLLKS